MDALNALLVNLRDLFFSVVAVFGTLGEIVLPWTPLIAWIAFWLLAVNWVTLRSILLRGGWVGFLLIGLVMILVWGAAAPPLSGGHKLLGLTLSNYVGKTVYVTFLLCIALVCGSVQLSGAVRPVFSEADEEPANSGGH